MFEQFNKHFSKMPIVASVRGYLKESDYKIAETLVDSGISVVEFRDTSPNGLKELGKATFALSGDAAIIAGRPSTESIRAEIRRAANFIPVFSSDIIMRFSDGPTRFQALVLPREKGAFDETPILSTHGSVLRVVRDRNTSKAKAKEWVSALSAFKPRIILSGESFSKRDIERFMQAGISGFCVPFDTSCPHISIVRRAESLVASVNSVRPA